MNERSATDQWRGECVWEEEMNMNVLEEGSYECDRMRRRNDRSEKQLSGVWTSLQWTFLSPPVWMTG